MHKHITKEDRAIIAGGLRVNESYRDIAEKIGKNVFAVWQEVQWSKETLIKSCGK